MLWKFARPKVGAPQEFENVRLVQFGVAMWCNQLLVHLRIFGPVHVAVHVMNGMVAIVACDPVDHWTREVPSGIHIHFGTFVLSKNNVLRPVMLQHVHGYDGICTEDVWNHPAKNCSAPVKIEQNACSAMCCHHLEDEKEEGLGAFLRLVGDELRLQLLNRRENCWEE